MKQHLSRNEIVDKLRTVADNLEQVDEGNFFQIWMDILTIMERHNPEMRECKIGKSMAEQVKEELVRLYAVDAIVKRALVHK